MSRKDCLIVVAGLLSLLFTGCGVADKALVFAPQSEISMAENVPGETVSEETVSSTQLATEQVGVICVHVCGAVMAPGVVEISADSRVADALEAAGGFAENAQTDYVNLASRVEDGQQIYFPTEEKADVLREEARVQEQAEQQQESGIVNINTADITLLCTLPGIGESRAQDIINYRKLHGAFEEIEDIMLVSGIKESVYEKICHKIVVD